MMHFKEQFESGLLEEIKHLSAADIPKDTYILREEAYIKEIPLVMSGNIKVRKTDESGKEIILYHIEPGESCILSITSCLNNKKSQAEAITDEETQMIVVPVSKVKEWMDTYKSWWGLVGIVPVFTALISWCPLYFPFGIRTCSKS